MEFAAGSPYARISIRAPTAVSRTVRAIGFGFDVETLLVRSLTAFDRTRLRERVVPRVEASTKGGEEPPPLTSVSRGRIHDNLAVASTNRSRFRKCSNDSSPSPL